MSEMIPESWKVYQLSSILKLKHGYQFRTPDFRELGVKVVKIGQVIGDGKLDLTDCNFISEELAGEKRDFLLSAGDILMSLTGNIGRVGIVPDIKSPLIQNYRVGKFVPLNKHVEHNFLYQLLSSNIATYQFEINSNTTAQANFGKSDIDKVTVNLPPLAEQKKIGDILTSVDQVIEKTESEISKLQDLKKGMMQQLLTQEIGHTQFKDSPVGRVPVGWDLSKCSNLCSRIFVGIASSTTHAYSDQTGVVILRNQNILDNKIDQSDLLYINKEFSEENASKKLKKGDVISARTGYPGISAVISSEFENCHTFTTLISRPNHQTILPEFYCRFLNSSKGKNQINKLQAGGAQQNLNVEMMKEILIPLPPLEEQKKIADILTSIDDSIQQEEKELEQTQNLKKSLMQDLLTGKVRVKVD